MAAGMEVHMVADMDVDKVVDKLVDMMADMAADKKRLPGSRDFPLVKTQNPGIFWDLLVECNRTFFMTVCLPLIFFNGELFQTC